ncbi:unnamed protein product [Haemonchus placei]|uniref:Secreted protein n=1 Tax=Haemonchus placei TaxID=6290 RepID=A0A0N4WEM0_HAEPC|nr:unnamed protein product [Haemonchus placei]
MSWYLVYLTPRICFTALAYADATALAYADATALACADATAPASTAACPKLVGEADNTMATVQDGFLPHAWQRQR